MLFISSGNTATDDHTTCLNISDRNTVLVEEVECLRSELEYLKKTYRPKSWEDVFNIRYGVNISDVKDELKHALAQCPYEGEQVWITSGNDSQHSHRSQHYTGEAVDISYWRNKEFAEWLTTEQAKEWLDQYDLEFEYENIYDFKDHDRFSYNKHASSPHIHLHLKRKTKHEKRRSVASI